MKHFLQKYLCHLREKRKHGRCYIHGVIDSYNNICFRWETEDLSSADEDVPTDDISVSSSSNSASPLNSEGKCNSQAVGWDSWVPSALKLIFGEDPIFESAGWFSVIIVKFIYTPIFEIIIHEKNSLTPENKIFLENAPRTQYRRSPLHRKFLHFCSEIWSYPRYSPCCSRKSRICFIGNCYW